MAPLDPREPGLYAAHSAPSGRWWVTPLRFSCHSLGSSSGLEFIRASYRTYWTALSGAGRITSVLLHRDHSCTLKPFNSFLKFT